MEGVREDHTHANWRPGFLIDYHVVEILKGQSGPLVNSAYLPGDVAMYIPGEDASISNPALKWAREGERVLVFSNDGKNRAIAEPCKAVPATPAALQAIRTALSSHSPTANSSPNH